MTLVGGYTLHLYCDGGNHDVATGGIGFVQPQNEYAAKTYGQCIKQARADGWIIGKWHQLCPVCAGKKQDGGK